MSSPEAKGTEMKDRGVLIVGGGLASQRCAETLRRRGYEGRIRMVCGEPERPYDRPPLSKDHLAGGLSDDDVAFRPLDWYADNRVELIIGRQASGLDAKRRRVELDDGTELFYDDLVVATGAGARRLSALEGYTNVHYLRTLADARHLREELREGARLAVVGAGFIGQEVASTARAAGAEVTIVEALPAPLTGILGEEVGLWLMKMHDEEGVDVRLGMKLEGARGNGAVEELLVADGEPLACDAVVVGIGVAPATGWLDGSGLQSDGVRTDHAGRTAVQGIWAAGDVARSFDHRHGEHRRSEHWDAAARQGMAVARAITGEEPDPHPLPSFWSDQYGLRIQYVGHAEGADAARIEGRPGDRDFAVVYTREERPVGALVVGRPKDFARLRKEIERTYEEQTNGKEQR
jgi:NADPH-dependent 2,4-dienoyl-CoA reductase/sulfur reductase-like enzyme